jgi:hypothetical protein
MSIRSTAAKRIPLIKRNDPTIYAGSSAVSRIAPPVSTRETASAADAKQVRNRLQMEQLPEANIRRGKRRGAY